MASDRRIEALRALADRPGTEHEGKLAREILERLEKASPDEYTIFRGYLRREVSLDELLSRMKRQPLTPEEQMMVDEQERARKRHELRLEIRRKFKKNDKVVWSGKPGTITDYGYDGGVFVKFEDALWPRHVTACVDGEWKIEADTSSCCTPAPSEHLPVEG